MKTKSISCQFFCVLAIAVFVGFSSVTAATKAKKATIKIVNTSTKNNIPFDPAVKIGTLPNGFTYYIRKNSEPQNRVTIYLANKAGSILENEDQRGLAHFVEHMSFNGTTHFHENELVSYLQKSGIKFGSDLNAYTSFDETIYQLPLPTDDPQLLRNGFQIMRDWAQEATMDSLEIEKERGVILEEERLSKNSQERLRVQFFPMLTNNSRYCERVPIGIDKVLTGFKKPTIVDFYKKWYRPNLQALVVVGDIDVAATEQTIKNMFSDLKNPVPSQVREEYKISLTGRNQFLCATDKEVSLPAIQLFVKYEKEPLITINDYKRSLTKNIFNFIISERLSDLSKQPNSPFLQAQAQTGGFIANLDAFTASIAAKPELLEKAFRTVWTELQRIKQNGFSNSEIDRAKRAIEKGMESGFNERTKSPSSNYVQEYVRNFLNKEACPGIEFEYNLCKQLLPSITEQDIATSIKKYMGDVNRDILIVGADINKEILPKEEDVIRWIGDIQNSSLAPLNELNQDKPLLAQKPVGRKVIKQSVNKALGTTELSLENGVKIVLKPTDFKNNEIKFTAFSPGGTSLYADADYESAAAAVGAVIGAGLGDFDLSHLQKFMTDKQLSVSPYINERFEGFNGGSTPADLETMLQTVYLYFTSPRKDFSIIKGELDRSKASLAERGSDPATVFSDTVSAIMSNYNVRKTAPSVDKINRIDLERAYNIYKERFADASDFTFTFVGNFDVEKIKPLLEQYLGALPAINRKESAHDLGIHIPEGKVEKKVAKGLENKSTVRLVFSGTYNYNDTENNKLETLADLLTIKLIEKLREEESGVYGVGASAKYGKYPQSRYSISIGFGCAPSNVDKLIKSTLEIIDQVKKELPLQVDVDKVLNEDQRSIELQLKSNGFWLNYLTAQLQLNESPESILNYNKELKKITPSVLQSAAKQYLTGENYALFVLYPEK